MCQNIANNKDNPKDMIDNHEFIKLLFITISEDVTEMNQTARQNVLCAKSQLSSDTRAKPPGRGSSRAYFTADNLANSLNATAAEKAMAVIANMANKKENNLLWCKLRVPLHGHPIRQVARRRRGTRSTSSRIAAGSLETAPVLLASEEEAPLR